MIARGYYSRKYRNSKLIPELETLVDYKETGRRMSCSNCRLYIPPRLVYYE